MLRPMSVSIDRADFDDPALARFLQDHLDDLAPTAPVESRHALDIAALMSPGVRLWVAREGSDILGTAALAALEPGHEELKSMRTHPARRGEGIASRLLEHLLPTPGPGACGASRWRPAPWSSSRRLGRSTVGPVSIPCPPFGSYTNDPNSTFMTLEHPFEELGRSGEQGVAATRPIAANAA